MDAKIYKVIIPSIIIFVLTLLNYINALNNQFVWDTKYYLNNNIHITSFSYENLRWMATSLYMDNWHPLTWVSYAIDYQLYGGLDTRGFHLTSIIIHALNSIMFYILTIKIMERSKIEFNSKFRLIVASLITALLFAIHPQHIESVAWVAERKDVLSLFFILLTFFFYMEFAEQKGTKRKIYYCLSLTTFILALMSKTMAVTVTALLILFDIYPLKRLPVMGVSVGKERVIAYKKIVVEKIPFFALTIAVIVITLISQQQAMPGVERYPLDLRVLNAIYNTFFYLSKFFIPIGLSPLYPHLADSQAFNQIMIYPAVFAFAAITIAVVFLALKNKKEWLVAWLFYLIALSPVIGIIQVGQQGAADRYAYLPTLPIYLIVSFGAFYLADKLKVPKIVPVMMFVVLSALLIMASKDQIKTWATPVSLWNKAVKSYPDYGYAHGHLANALTNIGYYSEAIRHFEKSNSLGQLKGNYLHAYAKAAIEAKDYNKALSIYVLQNNSKDKNPEWVVDESCTQFNIGLTLAHLGIYQQALALLTQLKSSDLEEKKRDLVTSIQRLKTGEIKEIDIGICFIKPNRG